jgi:hypothetical protein
VPGEEVTFYSGGCAIAGTFTEAADPVAAALLVPGGGKSDRNSDARLPGGRMLRTGVDKAIAGALAGARVCALRYDKRGSAPAAASTCAPGWMTGVPTRGPRSAGWPPGPAASRCSPGHSEGAWYAAELAADHAVAGAVLLAGGARPARRSCPGRPRWSPPGCPPRPG